MAEPALKNMSGGHERFLADQGANHAHGGGCSDLKNVSNITSRASLSHGIFRKVYIKEQGF